MKRPTKSAAKLVVLENDDPISTETHEIEERIRERAYQLSQERGHSGRDMEDWLTAESEIISVPPVELIEKDGVFQVRLAIVGMNLENMRVMTSPEQVLIRGDYRHNREAQEGTVHLSDFKSATVFRSVRFPQPVDSRAIDIEFRDGILEIIAPKASAGQARPKRVAARKAPAKKKRAS